MSGRPSTAGVSTALLTDHYELTMVAAGAAGRHGRRAAASSRCSPAGCRPAGATAWSPGTGAAARRDQPVPVRRRRARRPARGRRASTTDARLAGRLPVHRRHRRLRRGRAVLPRLAGADRDRHFAECVLLETLVLSVLNHDCAIAAAAARMVTAAARPAAHRDGLPAHPRGGGRRRRPGRLPGRLLVHVQPGRRPPLRRAHHRHRRARVHAAARRRAGRVRGPGRRAGQETTLLVDTYDIAAGHPDRDRGRRAGAGRDPDRLGRPADAGRARPASCSTRSARPTRRSSSPATWTSTRSRRSPPSRSTPTAPAPRVVTGSGAPTAGLVYKLVEVDGGRW